MQRIHIPKILVSKQELFQDGTDIYGHLRGRQMVKEEQKLQK